MAERRQLPPQIRPVKLAGRSDGEPVVRYQPPRTRESPGACENSCAGFIYTVLLAVRL
jgi:hypothetical protein